MGHERQDSGKSAPVNPDLGYALILTGITGVIAFLGMALAAGSRLRSRRRER